jgi:hypothetical protein
MWPVCRARFSRRKHENKGVRPLAHKLADTHEVVGNTGFSVRQLIPESWRTPPFGRPLPPTRSLLDLLQPAAVNLARADDVKLQRIERRQVVVIQHEGDVVHRQHLPGVQTDQNIPAL